MTAFLAPLLPPTSWADPDGPEVAADDVEAASTAAPDGVGVDYSKGALPLRLERRVLRFGPFFSSATSMGSGGGVAADGARSAALRRANLSSFLSARYAR